ncbi:MAG: transglycosylase family protein [bacterium]
METATDIPPVSGRRDADASIRSLRWSAAAGALAIAAIIALSAVRADAQSVDQLQARIDSAQGEAQGLAAKIQSGSAELAATRDRAVSAATREAELTSVLAAGEAREAALRVDVERSQARLAEARARLHKALDALSERLIAIYKDGPPDATTLLLDSNGFDDLTTRATLLNRIQEADQSLATRVRSLRADLADRFDEVSEARDAQAAHNDEVAAARDQIAAARARAEAQTAALEQARDEQARSLESLRSQVSGWEQDVEDAQAVSAAQAQETVAGWVGEWAIPAAIVMCESGGNYQAVNSSSGAGGAYQILPSTWRLYGGQGLPQNAPAGEQDRIAAMIWADSGGAAWVCAG